MATLNFNNIGLAIKGGGIFIGRSAVLHNLDRIGMVVFAKDMSGREKYRILKQIDSKTKTITVLQSKNFIGELMGYREVGIFGIRRKFVPLLLKVSEKG